MPQPRSHEASANTPTDRTDGSETQAPATNAYTDTPGQALPKDGAGGWGVAARWFVFALLAVAFVASLMLFFPR